MPLIYEETPPDDKYEAKETIKSYAKNDSEREEIEFQRNSTILNVIVSGLALFSDGYNAQISESSSNATHGRYHWRMLIQTPKLNSQLAIWSRSSRLCELGSGGRQVFVLLMGRIDTVQPCPPPSSLVCRILTSSARYLECYSLES